MNYGRILRSCAPLVLLLASCNSSPERYARLECWGEMRNVLREGQTHGRVRLAGVARPGTWGIGALAGLEGEVTILDGVVTLSVVENGMHILRPLGKRDQATLLVLATVEQWIELGIPEVRNISDLSYALSKAVEAAGFDAAEQPVPVRIEGQFDHIGLHVLDHSCPVSNPGGPPPWVWRGDGTKGSIVGVYAQGKEGELTHHGQDFHLHAVVHTREGVRLSGHLDEVSLGAGVRLFLPVAASKLPAED